MTSTEALQVGTVLGCGHPLVKPDHLGTGYVRTANDFTMCYLCADEHDRSAMANANEHFGYLSSDGKHITTWTGGELAKIIGHGVAPNGWYGSDIHFIRASAPDGSEWYGRNGGEGMVIKIKRAKGK